MDEKLYAIIRPLRQHGEGAGCLFLRTYLKLQGAAFDRQKSLVNELEGLDISSFVPWNITLFAAAYLRIANELLSCHKYTGQQVISLVVRLANVPASTFSLSFRNKILPARSAVLRVDHLGSNLMIMQALQQEGYHPHQLCEEAIALHDQLVLSGLYEPAQNKKDSAAAPELNNGTLVPTPNAGRGGRGNRGGGGGRGNGAGRGGRHDSLTCHRCGTVGHISRNCPQKDANTNNNNSNSNGSDPNAWKLKFTGPTVTRDGVVWKWCGKCRENKGRYTLSHDTSGNKTPSQLNPGRGRGGNSGTNGGAPAGGGKGTQPPPAGAPPPSVQIAEIPTDDVSCGGIVPFWHS